MLAAAVLLAAAAPAPAAAQSLPALHDTCVAEGGLAAACTIGAVAARALAGHLGILSSFGSRVPGTASTLGRRIGSSPRISVSVRTGGLRAALPNLGGSGGGTEERFFVPALHLGLGVGAFDGFSPLPTVGGVLSLDLLGQAGFLFLPRDRGFSGGARVLSLGARLGLLRESFTLPGLSVSVTRHWVRRVQIDGPESVDPAEVVVDGAVTSVRAAVGKDLFGVGVLAGVGWDDHSADVLLRVDDGAGGRALVEGPLDVWRRSYFAGVSRSFIVLQISAEAGWVRGFGPVQGLPQGAFDPEGGSLFASVAVRLTP